MFFLGCLGNIGVQSDATQVPRKMDVYTFPSSGRAISVKRALFVVTMLVTLPAICLPSDMTATVINKVFFLRCLDNICDQCAGCCERWTSVFVQAQGVLYPL